MRSKLNPEQEDARASFRVFVDEEIVPRADEWHRLEQTPPEVIKRLAERGYLGFTLPTEFGGGGRDMVTLGLLAGELGRGCSSIRSLLTVHSMVGHAILRWGEKKYIYPQKWPS